MTKDEPKKPAGIRKVLLVGNPNVGKSVLFGALTGRYAIVSNYPGTTVEFSRANVTVGGQTVELVDTPGVNGLVPQSEDERVTRDIILRESPDVVIQVGDAKNIRRTLSLTLQLAEFRIPMVLNLNLIDECRARGIQIDTAGIAEAFGIPVNTSIATMGEGVHRLLRLIPKATVPKVPVRYHPSFAAAAAGSPERGFPRALALEWFANEEPEDIPFPEALRRLPLLRDLRELARNRGAEGGPDPRVHFDLVRNRFLEAFVPTVKTVDHPSAAGAAGARFRWAELFLALGLAVFVSNALLPLCGLAGPWQWVQSLFAPLLSGDGVLVGREGVLVGNGGLLFPGLALLGCTILPPLVPFFRLLSGNGSFNAAFDRWSRRPVTGLAIVALVLSAVYVLVGNFGAQVMVELLEEHVFRNFLTPGCERLVHLVTSSPFVHDLFVGPYGLVSKGLAYSIAIVAPVVATFFLAFGFLEDCGYLPRLSILLNRAFRVVGLNGKAVLPMVLGLGCVTMAVMTARVLNSKKERLIATLLLALGIPCSAQLGVMLGIFSGFSIGVALVVFVTVGVQTILVGFLASRLLHGATSDFILEIPPVRYPSWKNIWLKTGLRVGWFLKEAVPLFLLGTFLLFLLDRFTVLERVVAAARPVVKAWLGLPEQTAQVFVMGFLRRDFGAAGLLDMVQRGLFDGNQVAVALVVLTLFVPCVASFFMIVKEQRLRRGLLVASFIVPFAVLTGVLVRLFLTTFGIRL